ncbi:54S ribosomal protein L9 [Mactra antiquata]
MARKIWSMESLNCREYHILTMFPGLNQLSRCTCQCLLSRSSQGGSLVFVRKYENPNTAVFERKHPIQNSSVRKYPLVKKKNYVYKKINSIPGEYQTTMKCILTTEVEDIGLKGTVVEVPKRLFRNVLYPRGDAVYASPENIKLYEGFKQDSEEAGIDYEVKQLMRSMSGYHLRIFMNPEEKWTLNVEHVRIAFRKLGTMISEDNIVMPDEPVSTFGDFIFKVQMNNRIAAQVRATVYPLGTDNIPDSTIEYPPVWGNEPIDPDMPIEFIKQEKQDTSLDDDDITDKHTNKTDG